MKTAEFRPNTEEMRATVTNVLDRATEAAEGMREKVDAAYREVYRGARKFHDNAEDAIDKARIEVRNKPFQAITFAAVAGLCLGLGAGWYFGSRRK